MDDKFNSSNMHKDFVERVRNIVALIRRSLQGHGGDVKLLSIDEDNSVKVRLEGTGDNSPESQKVLKNGVKTLIKQLVPEVKKVIAIT